MSKKIEEKLKPIAWHSTRMWDVRMTKDEKSWNCKSNAQKISIETF